MNILSMCILWSWGLTPVWVNVIGTVILGLRSFVNLGRFCKFVLDDMEKQKKNEDKEVIL